MPAGIPLLVLLTMLTACERRVAIDHIETPPPVTAADTSYAGVYRPLDGQWRGRFYIYEDTVRVERDASQLRPPRLDTGRLALAEQILVQQAYTSVSPYFQRVKITDIYPERGDTVRSEGVNKVQDGQMWCVVRKPEETVIHQGKKRKDHTIVWRRSEQDPQKIEYFYETVSDSVYEITGWGYYEGHDTTLMPPFWFYGLYRHK